MAEIRAIPDIGRWEETDGGGARLFASQCLSCKEVFFPERAICPRCGGDRTTEVHLEGPAQLYDYTVVHELPQGFPKPLVVGHAEFPGRVLILAPIEVGVSEAAKLRLGDSLQLCSGMTRVDANGEPMVSYRFRPVVTTEEIHHA